MLKKIFSHVSTKKNIKYLLVFIAVVLIIIAIKRIFFMTVPTNNAALPLITLIKVVTRDFPITVTEVGTVTPIQTVAIKSRVDSQINEILFKDGDLVSVNQPLFKLDDRLIVSQIAEEQANYNKEKAVLENLKIQYERTQKIAKSGFETQSNLDKAKSDFDAQAANLEATAAALNSLKVQLSYCTINSPIAGKAGIIKVTVGNEVKANDTQPLVTINQLSPIKVEFSLAQKYFDRLIKAQKIEEVKVKALKPDVNEVIEGKLKYLNNELDLNSDSIVVGAEFPNEKQELWPGMYVNVSIVLEEVKDAKIIPNNAIQNGQNDTKYIYVIKDKIAHKRPIKIQAVVDDEAIITEGVEKDDEIAIDGIEKLTDGAKVKTS